MSLVQNETPLTYLSFADLLLAEATCDQARVFGLSLMLSVQAQVPRSTRLKLRLFSLRMLKQIRLNRYVNCLGFL